MARALWGQHIKLEPEHWMGSKVLFIHHEHRRSATYSGWFSGCKCRKGKYLRVLNWLHQTSEIMTGELYGLDGSLGTNTWNRTFLIQFHLANVLLIIKNRKVQPVAWLPLKPGFLSADLVLAARKAMLVNEIMHMEGWEGRIRMGLRGESSLFFEIDFISLNLSWTRSESLGHEIINAIITY